MMGTVGENDWDEKYSVIGDKGEVGFLDYDDDRSLSNFDLNEGGPIVISSPFGFIGGKPQSVLIGQTSTDSISIHNTTSNPIDLWSIKIFSSIPEDSYILSLMEPPSDGANKEKFDDFVGSTTLEDRVLQPGQTLTVWLSCKPNNIGLHTAIVHFDLGDEKIERVAFLLADDKVSEALSCNKPYSRAPRRGRKFDYDQYVPGSRPSRITQGSGFRIPQYNIPKDIREIVESKQVPDVVMEGLTTVNYSRYFSTLINMEEIHLEEEMRAHDMECVTMKRRGSQFLSLEVPGLAERRPSLVSGDFIFAKLATDGPDIDSRPFQGYIHRVEADEIFLKFDKILHQHHREDDLYNVSFTYHRLNMRRLYYAVETAERLGPEVLFPSQSSGKRVIKTMRLNPLNPNINKEQARSVEMILGCQGAPPYVIHGPPGTGKTMTLVEAILQLYTTRRRARILVCASSNSAADHILEKLLEEEVTGVRHNEVFRLNATSRPYEDVKPNFIQFCFFDDMVFKCPPLRALLRYRIIISTYMSSSLLHAEGIRKGHFSHIFLDEAGQASEPETMVPISNLCVRETAIVLAGDPRQLGPVVYSRDAEDYGLGRSYLERLFECEYYVGDENYVTKLVRNYRCHPAILELPSKLFYNGELIACKEENESYIYDWVELPNKAFPVYFVGIQGCDEREGNNPSWFNRIEASKVVEIIRKLIEVTDVGEDDIGVITPYRQQVLKLKKALELLEMPNIKVGSVEQFQGQERQIIIISTVRSTVKHNEFDRTHSLGFLSNPRRFNVATTRARSLLIIVGNPHIIAKDPHWDKLLRHCADNGSYRGCPLPAPEWNDLPDQAPYGDVGEGDNPNLYSDGGKWNEDIPNQYSNGADWAEDVLNQYKNDVEWEDVPKQCSNPAESCEDTSEQYLKKAECGDATSKPYLKETEWGELSSKQHSNDSERDEDTSKSCSVVAGQGVGNSNMEWGNGTYKPTEWVVGSAFDWGGIPYQPSGWDD